MFNKDVLKILEEASESLNKMDKFVTFDGLSNLLSAKQQIVLARTILQVEEQLNENQNDE